MHKLLPFFLASAGLLLSACSKSNEPAPAPAATAAFSMSRRVVEVNEPVVFANASTNATRYEWRSSQPGGPVLTSASPQMQFAAPGTYTVSLSAYNADNVASTTSQTVRVGRRFIKNVRLHALSFVNSIGASWHRDGTGPNVYLYNNEVVG